MQGEETAIRDNLAVVLQSTSSRRTVKRPSIEFDFFLILRIVQALYREKRQRTSSVWSKFNEHHTHAGKMSMDSIMQALIETALVVGEQLNSKKNGNKLFDAVLSYIQQNYQRDISRETVAREVFITPGYVSLLFKQQMQTSFLDYLHRIRIDHACRKFLDKGIRIADIAHEVGYQDEKYFFQVFKKYTGMTPNQYRNQTTEEH